MFTRTYSYQLIFIFVCLLLGGAAVVQTREKKLIEFGWDEPDTRFLLRERSQLERSPFDGCVFHAYAYDADNKPAGNLTWESWGTRKFTETEMARSRNELEELARSGGRRMRHFLRFNTTPARIDWFDDHSAVVHNARMAAGLARAGRCAGILLDTEQYEGALFQYSKQRDASSRSFDEYAKQARQRGFEVMTAFQREFPDIHVMLTFAHSYTFRQMQHDETAKQQKDVPDGLLAPFVDGMIAAAEGKAKIVDGYELSYSYRDRSEFVRARDQVTKAVRPIVLDHEKYKSTMTVGFGLWLDYDWRKNGWSETNPDRNYFTPTGFASSLRSALELCDEYVWIYTEQPRWWTAEGKPSKLSPAYVEVIRKR